MIMTVLVFTTHDTNVVFTITTIPLPMGLPKLASCEIDTSYNTDLMSLQTLSANYHRCSVSKI